MTTAQMSLFEEPTMTADDPLDLLRNADLVLLNSSGGKDSQAMVSYVAGLAAQVGALDKIVVVHCDATWAGSSGPAPVSSPSCTRGTTGCASRSAAARRGTFCSRSRSAACGPVQAFDIARPITSGTWSGRSSAASTTSTPVSGVGAWCWTASASGQRSPPSASASSR